MSNAEIFLTVTKVTFTVYSKPHTEFFLDKTDLQIHQKLSKINPDYQVIAKEEGLTSLSFASIDELIKLNTKA